MATSTKFPDIEWPTAQHLTSKPHWQQGVKVVKILLELGFIKDWLPPYTSGYKHFPFVYVVEGVEIQFLPHLTHCMMGKKTRIRPPTNREDMLRAVCAVKLLQEFGVDDPFP